MLVIFFECWTIMSKLLNSKFLTQKIVYVIYRNGQNCHQYLQVVTNILHQHRCNRQNFLTHPSSFSLKFRQKPFRMKKYFCAIQKRLVGEKDSKQITSDEYLLAGKGRNDFEENQVDCFNISCSPLGLRLIIVQG